MLTNYLNVNAAQDGGTVSHTFASVSPVANSLVVAIVGIINRSASTADVTTVSGGGLTWTRRASIVYGDDYFEAIEIWTAPTGATPAALALTVAASVTARECTTTVHLVSWPGTEVSLGDPFVQAKGSTGITALDAYSYNLDAAASASNVIVAARYALPGDYTVYAASPGSGWTEISDGIDSSGYGQLESQTITGSTSAAIAWADIADPNTAYYVNGVALAVELRGVVSATPTTSTVAATAGAPTASVSALVGTGIGASVAGLAGAPTASVAATLGTALTATVAASAGAPTASVGATIGPTVRATPSIGSHDQKWISLEQPGDISRVTDLAVVQNGGYIVAFSAIGATAAYGGPPTDSEGNIFTKIAPDLTYAPEYSDSFVSTFGCDNVQGDTYYTMMNTLASSHEATFAYVEIINGGGLDGSPVTAQHTTSQSVSITCTGPAVLIAALHGWGTESAAPSVSAGWTVLEDYGAPDGESIQQTIAARAVSSAGTYTCTFTTTPEQGYSNLVGLAVKGAVVLESSVSAVAGGPTASATVQLRQSAAVVATAGAPTASVSATVGSSNVAAVTAFAGAPSASATATVGAPISSTLSALAGAPTASVGATIGAVVSASVSATAGAPSASSSATVGAPMSATVAASAGAATASASATVGTAVSSSVAASAGAPTSSAAAVFGEVIMCSLAAVAGAPIAAIAATFPDARNAQVAAVAGAPMASVAAFIGVDIDAAITATAGAPVASVSGWTGDFYLDAAVAATAGAPTASASAAVGVTYVRPYDARARVIGDGLVGSTLMLMCSLVDAKGAPIDAADAEIHVFSNGVQTSVIRRSSGAISRDAESGEYTATLVPADETLAMFCWHFPALAQRAAPVTKVIRGPALTEPT